MPTKINAENQIDWVNHLVKFISLSLSFFICKTRKRTLTWEGMKHKLNEIYVKGCLGWASFGCKKQTPNEARSGSRNPRLGIQVQRELIVPGASGNVQTWHEALLQRFVVNMTHPCYMSASLCTTAPCSLLSQPHLAVQQALDLVHSTPNPTSILMYWTSRLSSPQLTGNIPLHLLFHIPKESRSDWPTSSTKAGPLTHRWWDWTWFRCCALKGKMQYIVTPCWTIQEELPVSRTPRLHTQRDVRMAGKK